MEILRVWALKGRAQRVLRSLEAALLKIMSHGVVSTPDVAMSLKDLPRWKAMTDVNDSGAEEQSRVRLSYAR
jgi:hypothetical protein